MPGLGVQLIVQQPNEESTRDRETEAQTGWETSSDSHGWAVPHWRSKPRVLLPAAPRCTLPRGNWWRDSVGAHGGHPRHLPSPKSPYPPTGLCSGCHITGNCVNTSPANSHDSQEINFVQVTQHFLLSDNNRQSSLCLRDEDAVGRTHVCSV